MRSSPPSCHARAPHHREARVDTFARVARADADKIVESAKPPISSDQRAQPVAAHDLVTIEMSPMLPFPKTMITTKANVQIIGNTNEPKLHGVQTQALFQNPVARMHQRCLDFPTCKGPAFGLPQCFQQL